MNKKTKALIAGAAIAGLISGSAVKAFAGEAGKNLNGPSGLQKMACSGKDGCKGKDGGAADKGKHACKGKNDCKGMGGCKSGDNSCKGKNTCKGKGGCATDGSMEKHKE